MTTRAPSAASATAIEAPMPLLEPATRARRPAIPSCMRESSADLAWLRFDANLPILLHSVQVIWRRCIERRPAIGRVHEFRGFGSIHRPGNRSRCAWLGIDFLVAPRYSRGGQ